MMPKTTGETPGYADPPNPPGPDQEALHYMGTETIEREGLTFAPDTVQHVPAAVAYKLAGRDNLRIVAELPENWANWLAARARVRANRP